MATFPHAVGVESTDFYQEGPSSKYCDFHPQYSIIGNIRDVTINYNDKL